MDDQAARPPADALPDVPDAPPGGSGILIVDKPGGITSHQVVAGARRRLGTRRIGHAGTLDPMATGVMVLGVNRGTRLLGHLMLGEKTYEATIRLGQATTTDDAEGEVTAAAGAPPIDVDALGAAVAPYRGTIQQVPSAVSAIKVAGQRAYARVRRGEQVELAARTVTVHRYEVLAVRPGLAADTAVLDVDVLVECSSGTYIRALARDLGRDLGTGGHLTALRRTRVGPFRIEDAGERLLGLAEAVRLALATCEVGADLARDAVHGRPLPLALASATTAVLHGDLLLGLYTPDGATARPSAVLAEPADLNR